MLLSFEKKKKGFGQKFPVFRLSEIYNNIGYKLKRSIEEEELGEK